MIRQRKSSRETVSGLRTRYTPRSRIGHGLIGAAPWLDALLILFFCLLLESRVVLQPGVIVDLPREPFLDGSHSTLVAVILSVPGGSAGDRSEVVFFNDERFRIHDPEQAARLSSALAERVREDRSDVLVIQSDRRVPEGTIVRLLDMALEAGVSKVNMATRPF